jgi:UDP-N-acetylglucosamine 2-epimerase (non-hydrolysing)
MRVVTLFGTRPEIIRLSRVIGELDAHAEHVLVHTGQNYDPALSDVFFDELALRQPDVHLGIVATSFAEQAALILQKSSEVFAERRPDRLLILGDTNSGLRPSSQRGRASQCSTWRQATAASTTGCRRRSTAASSTTRARC